MKRVSTKGNEGTERERGRQERTIWAEGMLGDLSRGGKLVSKETSGSSPTRLFLKRYLKEKGY